VDDVYKNVNVIGKSCLHEAITSIEQYSPLPWDKKLCKGVRGCMFHNLPLVMCVCVCVCVNVFFFSPQTIRDGTPPTKAQSYIKTHTKKDESYPKDVIKDRCVCNSPSIFCEIYVCYNFLRLTFD
jgi:hypothetical protein